MAVPCSAPQVTQPPRREQPDAPAFRNHPSKLFVELTSRCNLSCTMCMKQAAGNDLLREGDMSRETFLALAEAFPTLDALILNGIGESLLHPDLEEFVRIARRALPPHAWVGFQSNGLLLDEARALALVDAGLDKICLSLDAVCPDMFRTIREGGEVTDLEKAFAALAAARAARPDSRLQVGVEFVVMRDNLHQLPDVLRWSASRGARFAIVTHLMPYDARHINQPVFEANSREAIALYQSWKERATAAGIDMSQYFFINFYKFYRTDEEQRVVDYVRDMVADARAKDIFFHVRNLIARDEQLAEEVAQVFARAEAVAREAGLELQLPEVSPTTNRRCDFIESGSAMVTWDGAVHPCYFLWHKALCHFSYWRKYVPGLNLELGSNVAVHCTYWSKHIQPKQFGTVGKRSLPDIWNDPAFLAFRREVLDNEYPYCANCNLVPCDYLAADQFDHDCYLTTVPCGDCFWGLGVFNCLQ